MRSVYDGANIEWEQRSIRSQQVTFGQVRYHPGGYCGPRIQRDYQLVRIYAGSCDVQVDGVCHTLRTGDVYLFKPGGRELFRFDRHTQTHHFWCSAAPDSLPSSLCRALDQTAEGGITPSECFTRLETAAFLLGNRYSAAAMRTVNALAQTLFAEFVNMADHAGVRRQSDVFVIRAVSYMEGHLGEEACLAGAQHAAGCSVNALIYKFRLALGVTPARHLWRLRTERGVELLADTGLSVAEIADRCGFKNPFHFSRCVRRIQGESPRAIRLRAWGVGKG